MSLAGSISARRLARHGGAPSLTELLNALPEAIEGESDVRRMRAAKNQLEHGLAMLQSKIDKMTIAAAEVPPTTADVPPATMSNEHLRAAAAEAPASPTKAALSDAPGPAPAVVPAMAEEIEALRRLTPEQQAAKDAADRAAVERHRAREAVPEAERAENARWKAYGGEPLEPLIEHTPLIDILYLIDLIEGGGVLPRQQEVPPEAFISSHNLWILKKFENSEHNSLPILVLSYPWLDWVRTRAASSLQPPCNPHSG